VQVADMEINRLYSCVMHQVFKAAVVIRFYLPTTADANT